MQAVPNPSHILFLKQACKQHHLDSEERHEGKEMLGLHQTEYN